MKKQFPVRKIVITGLMAAMVFVCTMFLKIPVPTPTGTTMLKTANAIALLAGLLFGGIIGGLAAGVGSALFDLTYPEYAATAWLTFIFFFIMGFLCGLISHLGRSGKYSKFSDFLGAFIGSVTYWFLYIGKSVLLLVISGSSFKPALIASIPKMITSGINAFFAIVVSLLLYRLLKPRLMSAGLWFSDNEKT